MKKNYDDMLDMEHHVSKNHPQMPLEKRAAQFTPFSALTGYEESLMKTKDNYEKNVLESENGKPIFDDLPETY